MYDMLVRVGLCVGGQLTGNWKEGGLSESGELDGGRVQQGVRRGKDRYEGQRRWVSPMEMYPGRKDLVDPCESIQFLLLNAKDIFKSQLELICIERYIIFFKYIERQTKYTQFLACRLLFIFLCCKLSVNFSPELLPLSLNVPKPIAPLPPLSSQNSNCRKRLLFFAKRPYKRSVPNFPFSLIQASALLYVSLQVGYICMCFTATCTEFKNTYVLSSIINVFFPFS